MLLVINQVEWIVHSSRRNKMSKYVERVLKETAARNSNEPEFLQAVDLVCGEDVAGEAS